MGKNDFGAGHWSSDKVWERRKRHKAKDDAARLVQEKGKDFLEMEVTIPLRISWISLLALHGALCLALRHPQFRGPSRGLVVNATQQIGKYLVDNGLLTPEQLAEAQQLEAEEGSSDLKG